MPPTDSCQPSADLSEYLGTPVTEYAAITSCGSSCVVNFDYTCRTSTAAPPTGASQLNARSIASDAHHCLFLQFNVYSITSAQATIVSNSTGECKTTTEVPVTASPPFTIALNQTSNEVDFSDVSSSSVTSLMSVIGCSLNAVEVSPTSSTLALHSQTSIRTASTRGSTAVTSLSVSSPSTTAPRRVSQQSRIILGVVIPVVCLASAAIFTWRIWRKRRAIGDEAQDQTATIEDYTKPELDAKQSRHEADGERERQDLAADQARIELDALAHKPRQEDPRSRPSTQELGGLEPRHEIDAQSKGTGHTTGLGPTDTKQNQQVLSRDLLEC